MRLAQGTSTMRPSALEHTLVVSLSANIDVLNTLNDHGTVYKYRLECEDLSDMPLANVD